MRYFESLVFGTVNSEGTTGKLHEAQACICGRQGISGSLLSDCREKSREDLSHVGTLIVTNLTGFYSKNLVSLDNGLELRFHLREVHTHIFCYVTPRPLRQALIGRNVFPMFRDDEERSSYVDVFQRSSYSGSADRERRETSRRKGPLI